MRKRFSIAIFVLLGGAFALPTNAQAAAKPATSSSQAVLEAWNQVGRKLIMMAEDFPEAKYDFKPTPAQRTFAEQLLHMAGSNDFFTQTAKGESRLMTNLAPIFRPRRRSWPM